jgi:hypothetical protein
MNKNIRMPANRDSIFHDRRNLAVRNNPYQDQQPCRRKTFGQSDGANWWLKVNYVSQHLRAVSDKNQKISDQHKI